MLTQEEFDRLTKQSEETITAKVIADSIAPNGCRLTTMEWTYPRVIHSEILTHRRLSRNSASSRAIPMAKMIKRVRENPFFPIYWGKNQKGMQANEELQDYDKKNAATKWMEARDKMIPQCLLLEAIGIHKQIGNRLLEPWMWITVIVSATNFENLFTLRCHPDAEPHFQNLSWKVLKAYDESKPRKVWWGSWHLPYFDFTEVQESESLQELIYELGPKRYYLDIAKISAGRCARVSYLTHDGRRDWEEDLRLYDRLASSKPLHASPLEHPAQARNPEDYLSTADWGNFDPGWMQFRKMHEDEHITKRTILEKR